MTLGFNRRAVGTFANRSEAEQALHELKDSGFSMAQVSIVARDVGNGNTLGMTDKGYAEGSKQVATDTQVEEGARTGAVAGSAFGGLTGLLVGLGALAIPGVGPVMVGGAVATALATALSGGAIGAAAGGLVGGLVGLGIPEDRAQLYSDRISRGDYVVMVEGSEEDINRAEAILNRRGIQDWGVFDTPVSSTDSASYASRDRY